MNKFNADVRKTGEDTSFEAYKEPSFSLDRQPDASYDHRLAELERENSRLHRLVAELLIRNQQLRKAD
jgi:hypothetical protein